MTKQKPIIFLIPEDLKQLVDNYWHEYKKPNRSAAIRELLLKALSKEDE